jgi:hypothetical protein
MHHTILLLAHVNSYTLDHEELEPESEVQAEHARVKEFTNLSLDQDKPHYI